MFINKIEFCVPQTEIELEHLFDEKNSFIKNRFDDKKEFVNFYKIYTKTHKILKENRSKLEVYSHLMSLLLSPNIDRKNIKYLIIADNYLEKNSSIGHFIQYQYQLFNSNIINISGNYCCNIETALNMSKVLLTSLDVNSEIIILTGNIIEDIQERIVGTYALLSDSFGGMIVSNKKKINNVYLEDVYLVTNGKLHQMNFYKDQTVDLYKLYRKSIVDILTRNNLSSNDLDYILTHNANTALIEYVLKSLGITPDKIFHNELRHIGHLDTVDLILNLKNINKSYQNKKVVSISNGAPGTFATCLFKI